MYLPTVLDNSSMSNSFHHLHHPAFLSVIIILYVTPTHRVRDKMHNRHDWRTSVKFVCFVLFLPSPPQNKIKNRERERREIDSCQFSSIQFRFDENLEIQVRSWIDITYVSSLWFPYSMITIKKRHLYRFLHSKHVCTIGWYIATAGLKFYMLILI